MKLVVAVDENWGIGYKGELLAHVRADLRNFAKLTTGHTVVLGSKTLATFPGGRPLPKRVNVVLSRSPVEIAGAVVVHSAQEAAEYAKDIEQVFVIGGGSVYRQMLPRCEKAYVTKVHCTPESDTFFPNLDEDPEWLLSEVLESGEEDGISYEMCLYTRA